MIADHERRIDLHTHTNHSDGELSPGRLLRKAQRYGLTAIAITDHDTVSPHTPEIRQHAEDIGIELVSGIEISTQEGGKPYHILGLLIDPTERALNTQLNVMQRQRITYAQTVCDLLGENLGLEIDREALFGSGGTITKGNISRAVVTSDANSDRLRGLFGGNIPTEGAFTEATMIREGQPCYVEKTDMTSPKQAVDLIHGAAGVAILAHPAFYVMKGEPLDTLCGNLIRWGGDGLEAINVQYDKSNGDREVDLTDEFTIFAMEHELVISGGSDYHTNKASWGRATELGFHDNPKRGVNYTILDNLRERNASRLRNQQ